MKWLKEHEHKRSLKGDVEKLRWIDGFLKDHFLDEIDRELIESIAHAKEAKGRAPATVNRYVAVIRSILRAACYEWDWIDKPPKARMRQEPRKRVRFLTRPEAERVVKELPEHLADMARFSFSTGLRMNNVVRLSWGQVNMQKRIAWINPDQSKTGKAIGVPLNSEAMSVLRRQLGKHHEAVFTYYGMPVTRSSTHAWYKALKRAGVENFRWHDWRHTWASWLAQEGVPLSVLQELGGWSTGEMVKRYAHLTVGHLAPYAERIAAGTNLAQSGVAIVRDLAN